MATGAQIITTFELQVNDITELSAAEELALANRVYYRVCRAKVWEFLKTNVSGSLLSDANGYYITIPDDFAFFVINNESTDNSVGISNNASPKVVFIGSNYQPYQVVNFSDRRQYRLRDGFCYLDLANSQIRFFTTPSAGTTYDFDYIKVPTALTTSTSPVFRSDFHDIISIGMAVENDVLQLSDKAKSYKQENQNLYDGFMSDMEYYNAQLQLD